MIFVRCGRSQLLLYFLQLLLNNTDLLRLLFYTCELSVACIHPANDMHISIIRRYM